MSLKIDARSNIRSNIFANVAQSLDMSALVGHPKREHPTLI